jgi:hypothetical protein
MDKVYIVFQDKNMPNINIDCETDEAIEFAGRRLTNQYAGIKYLVVEQDQEKSFFTPSLEFLFTVKRELICGTT